MKILSPFFLLLLFHQPTHALAEKSPQATSFQMTTLQGSSEGMRHICTLRWPGGLVAINLLSGKTEA